MIHAQDIDHVVIRARDIEPMVAFYRDVLCCPVEKIQEKFGLWQLRAGRSLIDLVDLKGPLGKEAGPPKDSTSRNMDHFCLRIDPWDPTAITAHLTNHGVEVGEVVRRYGADGYGPSIYLEDPEGNVVELKGPPDSPPDSPPDGSND